MQSCVSKPCAMENQLNNHDNGEKAIKGLKWPMRLTKVICKYHIQQKSEH